jgi:hypothetical protein
MDSYSGWSRCGVFGPPATARGAHKRGGAADVGIRRQQARARISLLSGARDRKGAMGGRLGQSAHCHHFVEGGRLGCAAAL